MIETCFILFKLSLYVFCITINFVAGVKEIQSCFRYVKR